MPETGWKGGSGRPRPSEGERPGGRWERPGGGGGVGSGLRRPRGGHRAEAALRREGRREGVLLTPGKGGLCGTGSHRRI